MCILGKCWIPPNLASLPQPLIVSCNWRKRANPWCRLEKKFLAPNSTYEVMNNKVCIHLLYRDISSTTGKIKRAILQFTPVHWAPVRWLDPTCTYMRFFALSQLVVFWQISELNTFFLKHIFEMPPSHPLVIARLCLVGVIVAPSVR